MKQTSNGMVERPVTISVVIPLYNEVESVPPLYQKLRDAMEPTGKEYELIFVDDGSNDGTLSALTKLVEEDPRVNVIKLRRNFGQTPAMRAGIDHARGAMVVTMDGDLQNDPADIPLLLAKIEEGNDLVTGWRFNRQDPGFSRKLPSRIANWLIAKVTGVPIHDTGCSLKAFRAELVKQIPLYSDLHRFIPAVSRLAGARIAEVPVRHHARQAGQSKYGWSRLQKVAIDLITVKLLLSFSGQPLRAFALLALPFFGLMTLAGCFAVIDIVFTEGNSSLIWFGATFLLLFLFLRLLMNGLIGELAIQLDHPEHRSLPLREQIRIPCK